MEPDAPCNTLWCPLRRYCKRQPDMNVRDADLGTEGLWLDEYDRWRCDWMIPEEDGDGC